MARLVIHFIVLIRDSEIHRKKYAIGKCICLMPAVTEGDLDEAAQVICAERRNKLLLQDITAASQEVRPREAAPQKSM